MKNINLSLNNCILQSGYPSKHLHSGVNLFKHTDHVMHNKITTFTKTTLAMASRAIKQLYDKIIITVFQ